jgi:hypothetical protein
MFIIVKDIEGKTHVCFLGTLEVSARGGKYYVKSQTDQEEDILIDEQECRRLKIEKKQEDCLCVEME